jgi:hypothetical protein
LKSWFEALEEDFEFRWIRFYLRFGEKVESFSQEERRRITQELKFKGFMLRCKVSCGELRPVKDFAGCLRNGF